jgi:hypothetical protein
MEIQIKKTLKVISKEYEIPYEELKNTAKKYLKSAKSYDENLYTTIDELLALVDINTLEEIDEFDINTLKMLCKLRDIDMSGSEKDIRKRVRDYFEELFEDIDSDEDSEEESDESVSDDESEVDSEQIKSSAKSQSAAAAPEAKPKKKVVVVA